MTTPQAFRRRQRVEGTLLLVFGVFTILTSIYFRGQDTAQRECISTYISTNSATGAIRSGLVEKESTATRKAILAGLGAQSIEDVQAARAAYKRALARIDQAREDNPVKSLPEGVCDS